MSTAKCDTSSQDSNHYKRRSDSALQRARVPEGAAPATKTKGVNHAAKRAELRDRAVIHAFERVPAKDRTNAAMSWATGLSRVRVISSLRRLATGHCENVFAADACDIARGAS